MNIHFQFPVQEPKNDNKSDTSIGFLHGNDNNKKLKDMLTMKNACKILACK